jgi:alkylation response protein AidB-like acyl-CoA dehydrogenase
MTAEVDLVRKEVRAVLAGPAARRAFAESPGDPRPLYRLLGERRLLAVNWPPAYGGRGLAARCAAAAVGELIAGRVPEVLHTLSVQICGNFLLAAGTEEQRAAILPGLASGRHTATVLYSEPGVGSDLSALTTTARPAGDGGWLITGRKVYSIGTALADFGLLAARTSTEPTPYKGITLFLVPLDHSGITIDALDSLADEDFADVRLDRVEVPAGAVIGPVGGAWPLITEALALERTGVDYVAKAELWLREANAERSGAEYERLRTHTAAARALALRCVDALDTGRLDPVSAAATKLWCGETARAVAWWCGLDSAYREAPGLTLSAGTSEMMLELVASSGLPLPDADEPLAAELRAAVRAVAATPDPWPDLDRLGLPDLGLRAEVICCVELGRELHDLTRIPAGELHRAAWLLGLAAGCLGHTIERTRTREQFGRALIANQDVAFRLARLAVRLHALTALVTDLAGRFDDGEPDLELAAGMLAEAGALALDITREAVQLHGAFGMTVASPVRRYYLAAPAAVGRP